MRLTGEEHFCCPAHKRLYNEEHSRIGLARLLEEVALPPEEEAPAKERAPAAPTAEIPRVSDALPEPELVYSGQGLRLWTYPYQHHSFALRFERFSGFDLAPADYVAGKAARGPRKQAPEPAPAGGATEARPAGKAVTKAARKKEKEAARKVVPVRDAPVPADKPAQLPEKPAAPKSAEIPAFASIGRPPARAKGGRYKIAAGVVLAFCLGAAGYLGLGIGEDSTVTQTSQSIGGVLADWIPNWAAVDAGEEIALFGPSQEWSDYRVQWTVDGSDSLAWVFRAADPGNYYAVQIQKAGGEFRMVRYAMLQGARLDTVESLLTLPEQAAEGLPVELEVKGSRFVLYLGGRSIAEWSDDRIPTGGFGVVRPDVGLAGVDDVKVTRLNGESASNRRFWTGVPPESLPEVTVLPPVRESSRKSEEL